MLAASGSMPEVFTLIIDVLFSRGGNLLQRARACDSQLE